jgi:voltage-gated potassium channel
VRARARGSRHHARTGSATAATKPHRLADLEPRRRRQAMLSAGLRVGLTWVMLVTVYYIVPDGKLGSGGALLRLAIAVVVVFAVVVWQTQRVLHAELPELRAAVSLAVLIPGFLLLFSTLYLSLSKTSASSFSEKLDHSSALYFAITVFSTVGFGDIVPKTDSARLVVSAQMLMDLVIIGVVVRALITAAKTGLGRAASNSASDSVPNSVSDSTSDSARNSASD